MAAGTGRGSAASSEQEEDGSERSFLLAASLFLTRFFCGAFKNPFFMQTFGDLSASRVEINQKFRLYSIA
jgi:hypothetical protein